jgi:AraC family transcriptional regulator of adaptative response/methylated-DNA-[protein]-cysteine methyltransferase
MSVEPNPQQIAAMHRVCRHIEKNLEASLSLAALGEHASLSPAHLQRLFKRVTGITPRQYADACRMGRFKTRLKEQRTITMAMYEVGFGSSSRLYERAGPQLGMTPATYQQGGRHARIHYTFVPSALGLVLLAGTDRGICAVSLGDGETEQERFLHEEFPAARIERNDKALRDWATEIVAHLAGERPHIDLPLDVQATAFQWRVWQELCRIPYGETRTYTEIAKTLGQPTAARAVARACATNPVSIVVPCHRVVREDGELAGYRWGIDRKKKLIRREGETKPE